MGSRSTETTISKLSFRLFSYSSGKFLITNCLVEKYFSYPNVDEKNSSFFVDYFSVLALSRLQTSEKKSLYVCIFSVLASSKTIYLCLKLPRCFVNLNHFEFTYFLKFGFIIFRF